MDVRRIRADFPIYGGDDPPVYLDSACQTLRPRQVIDAVVEYYEKFPVCAGRSLYSMASLVQLKCEEARESFARFLGAKGGEEIVFTKNTTEGINLVLFGQEWSKGDEIVCSDREHNSVLLPLQKLAEGWGVKIKRVQSLPDETFDPERVKEAVTRNTKLVVMCHTSNVTGYTIPAREVSEIAHDVGAQFLLDGAQSVPHVGVDVGKVGADYLSFSVHKMCGPSGVGILYSRSSLLDELDPLIYGGMSVSDTTYETSELLGPPHRFEAGLQNYAGILGAAAALKYVVGVGFEEIQSHERALSRVLAERLADVPKVRPLPPHDSNKRGGIFSFNVEGIDSHDLALRLDASYGIMTRSGYHCCHSWFHSRNINGCARASSYFYNDAADVDAFASAVREIASEQEVI